MSSIKFVFLILGIATLWWLGEQILDELHHARHLPIKERLKNLTSRIHSTVGIVAIVIVLMLLVRLIVLAAKCR